MTDTLTDPFATAIGGGTYFNAKEHLGDLAIVIEAKAIKRDQPHEYEGTKSTRDVAVADISCFVSQADVDARKPSVVLKDAQITAQVLVADIESNGWIGVPAITVVRKPKRAYVWRNEIDPAVKAAAAEWYTNRQAEIEANLAAVPDFL